MGEDAAELAEIQSDGGEERTGGSSSIPAPGLGIPEPAKPFFPVWVLRKSGSCGEFLVNKQEHIKGIPDATIKATREGRVTGCYPDSQLISLIPGWILQNLRGTQPKKKAFPNSWAWLKSPQSSDSLCIVFWLKGRGGLCCSSYRDEILTFKWQSSWNSRIVWVERHIKIHPVPTLTRSTIPGCSTSRPTWP